MEDQKKKIKGRYTPWRRGTKTGVLKKGEKEGSTGEPYDWNRTGYERKWLREKRKGRKKKGKEEFPDLAIE